MIIATLAVFHNLRVGAYSRLGLRPATCDKMKDRVLRGQYDEDLNLIPEDLDEDVDAGG